MSNSLSRLVTLMFFLALAVPTTVLAQTEATAELHGVMLDASGQPAAGQPWRLVTPENTQVFMPPTHPDGTFGAEGLPPGNYEVRVFEKGGNTENPIFLKQLTLVAGQKEKLEIRLGSGNAGGLAAGSPAAGSTPASIGVTWKAVGIFGLVLAAGLVVFFMMRSQRASGA